MSQACATSSPPLRSARALHRAEDIGSALQGGVNVCQRQLVKEVLGPLVAEFVRNFGREDATPIQRGSNASLLGRVQAVKLIRHKALRHLRAAPRPVGSLLSAPGSKFVPGKLHLLPSKRADPPRLGRAGRDSAYRSGRSPDWLKMKNSDAPAVTREAEEDWGK